MVLVYSQVFDLSTGGGSGQSAGGGGAVRSAPAGGIRSVQPGGGGRSFQPGGRGGSGQVSSRGWVRSDRIGGGGSAKIGQQNVRYFVYTAAGGMPLAYHSAGRTFLLLMLIMMGHANSFARIVYSRVNIDNYYDSALP